MGSGGGEVWQWNREGHEGACQGTGSRAVRKGALEFSYVAGDWETHERLELETDLIAAHVLTLGRVPPAQFIG